MRARLFVAIAALVGMLLAAVIAGADPPQTGLLKEMGLPEFPGSRLVGEINLPASVYLDDLVKEFGTRLGLLEIKQVNLLAYAVDAARNPRDIFKFYEPSIAKQYWKPVVQSFDNDRMLAVLLNDKLGLFIMYVDRPEGKDREMTMVRISGRIDPSKIAQPQSASFPWAMRAIQSASKIPVGQPISVPPSEKLYLRATGSAIKAQILDQKTAEIRLAPLAGDAGRLIRAGELLFLELTPRVVVNEIILSGAMPIVLEITEGSLALKAASGPGNRVARLSVIATGAPTTLESFPLVSGTHSVKAVGAKVSITLSQVQGGSLEAEVTGGDLTVLLPKDASAKLDVSALSGKIENLTGVAAEVLALDHMTLQLGDGKATIALKAVGGTVCIKMSN